MAETHIECLRLQVIFCKRGTNYRALLRKTTCTDNAYDVLTRDALPKQLENCAATISSYSLLHLE